MVPPRERCLDKVDNSDAVNNSNESPILASTRHLVRSNGSIVGREVAETILPQYQSFCSAIPTDLPTQPCLASIDGRAPISHKRIHDFIIQDFGRSLHQLGFGRGHRIALILPNGPELALAILATAQWSACVPLSANGAASELEADLLACGADLVIGPYSGPLASPPSAASDNRFNVLKSDQDWTVFRHIEESANRLGIPFCGLTPSPTEAGIFKLVPKRSASPLEFESSVYYKPLRVGSTNKKCNTANDEVLVLFTSGTTGNKKLVPHQLGDMLTAATTIALSWALTPEDVNCNLMPLFHVGGIVRQIFSPLISGGCVICCPSFDPYIFWALLTKKAFTWYYAAPTMHQLILHTHEKDVCGHPRLRMIANAAGGLLPSLAVRLRETFGANVLPSYGMTECMPISSPPANYQLTKPGTSGVAVGPEIAILNLCTVESLPTGARGPICVRGGPCFRGYGKLANDPNGIMPETFLKGGWFNTGDLGYLDEDGYLFVTGRSKEVINRGGEIISPMEVEEAVASHPDVIACAAFSANHDVLQEVVGLVLVMKVGRPRLDIPSLHEHLGERLAAPKWPQCLIFLDGLPRSHTNKLLRVMLGSRLGLPELNDTMSYIDRTFEGKCPPQGASLESSIPVSPVSVSDMKVQKTLAELLTTGTDDVVPNASHEIEIKLSTARDDMQLHVVPNANRAGALICYLYKVDRMLAIDVARSVLDRYSVPTHFIELKEPVSSTKDLPVPTMTDAVASLLQISSWGDPVDNLVQSVQKLFVDLLHLDYLPGPDANFFHLGGSSMLASQLASKIRKQFGVPCNGAEVFHHTNSAKLAQMIRQRSKDDATTSTGPSSAASFSDSSSVSRPKIVDDHLATFPSKRLAPEDTFPKSLFQLVPMFVLYPIWQVSRYLLFFAMILKCLATFPGIRNIGTLVIAYLVFHLIWITITPLVFVVIKWTVVGRYKAGRYPIWSTYYLRWWFVDVCRKLFLRGIWGSNETLLNFYYRLLGAKIGKKARISLECDMAEFDLVSIGEDAAIEFATVRAFGVDNGAMMLGPVSVGRSASVGARSVVAPYTSIPDGCHLGPVTSSYETGKALDTKHARYNRRCMPEPQWWMLLLIEGPITFLVNAFGQIPPLLVLFAMLEYKSDADQVFSTPSDLMEWLCDPMRIPFFIGIRVARALLSPFFYMAAAILVKKLFIGKFEQGPRDASSQWQLLRHHLSASLFSRLRFQAVADIVGRHYELVSCLYRLVGAKVGQRVFWPGYQPAFSGEFDLLEIGDDVVFGSRSTIFFATVDTCEKVTLCAGSNVSDNCVVLPGSSIGKNAVLGSNSVCPEGWYLPEESVWFGSNGCEPACLKMGTDVESFTDGPMLSCHSTDKIQMDGDDSTLRPFGRAFYLRQASYYVWPLSWIISATVMIKTFIVVFHTLPLLGALHGAACQLYGLAFAKRDYTIEFQFYEIYLVTLEMFFFTNIIRFCLWLIIELTAKWTLMGRRQEGKYNYDESSYAQRWELYQQIAKIRKFSRFNFLQFFFGTPYMASYFRWNGGTIGKDCCLYPTGADPFMPEPDLVKMGDRCVIDCASIVCHLNTCGNFELKRTTLENDCTLRTRSRIQQAVYMETGSQLLEKSLAMTGEVIEAYSVWQGGPASLCFQYDSKKGESVPFAGDTDNSDSDETVVYSKLIWRANDAA